MPARLLLPFDICYPVSPAKPFSKVTALEWPHKCGHYKLNCSGLNVALLEKGALGACAHTSRETWELLCYSSECID